MTSSGEQDAENNSTKPISASPIKLSLLIPENAGSPYSRSDSDYETPETDTPRSISGVYGELVGLPSPLLDQDDFSAPNQSIFKAYNGQNPPSGMEISRQSSLRIARNITDNQRVFSEYTPSPIKHDVGSSVPVPTAPIAPPRTADGAPLAIGKVRTGGFQGQSVRSISEHVLPQPLYIYLQRESIRLTHPQPTYAEIPGNNTSSSTARDVIKETDSPGNTYEAYDLQGIRSTWRYVKQLGRGAFSKVVLARPAFQYVYPQFRPKLDDYTCAIKVIALGTAGGASRAQIETGLMRELDILKTTHHPCLISLLAFNMDTSRALMVLPYYAGGDLFDFIGQHQNTHPSDPSSSTFRLLLQRIFAEVVHAVVYLHSKNIVHRDIKLENVLLKLTADELMAIEDPLSYPSSICALTDLGLARRIDPEDPMLTTRCGSDDYVPPELLMGQPYDGRQTDSWALGVLLYALLEQRLPFDPLPRPGGGRMRGRTSHRIARVEWSWVRFKSLSEEDPPSPWSGAIDIVEGCLQRRDKRWLASKEILSNPWITQAIPDYDNMMADKVFSIHDIFISNVAAV